MGHRRDSDRWKCVFSDNFHSLDLDVWNFETEDKNNDGWGNWEIQKYTERNAKIQNNSLHITLQKSETGWTSSRLTTKDKMLFTFGRVDVRLRTERRNGAWPAVWALSSAGDWPHNGEIDIFEMQTKWPFIPSSLHFTERHGGNPVSFKNRDVDTARWRVYSVEWTPKYIAFFHDNVELDRYKRPEPPTNKNWPYHENNKFFLIINNAMHPQHWGTPPDRDMTSHVLEVDYVKFWEYPQ